MRAPPGRLTIAAACCAALAAVPASVAQATSTGGTLTTGVASTGEPPAPASSVASTTVPTSPAAVHLVADPDPSHGRHARPPLGERCAAGSDRVCLGSRGAGRLLPSHRRPRDRHRVHHARDPHRRRALSRTRAHGLGVATVIVGPRPPPAHARTRFGAPTPRPRARPTRPAPRRPHRSRDGPRGRRPGRHHRRLSLLARQHHHPRRRHHHVEQQWTVEPHRHRHRRQLQHRDPQEGSERVAHVHPAGDIRLRVPDPPVHARHDRGAGQHDHHLSGHHDAHDDDARDPAPTTTTAARPRPARRFPTPASTSSADCSPGCRAGPGRGPAPDPRAAPGHRQRWGARSVGAGAPSDTPFLVAQGAGARRVEPRDSRDAIAFSACHDATGQSDPSRPETSRSPTPARRSMPAADEPV